MLGWPSERTSKNCKDGTCAVYVCVEDGSVIYGGGCVRHYKKTCKSHQTNVEIGTGEDWDGVTTERGNFLYLCNSPLNNCVLKYMEANTQGRSGEHTEYFGKEFLNGYDTTQPAAPSSQSQQKQPPPPKNDNNNKGGSSSKDNKEPAAPPNSNGLPSKNNNTESSATPNNETAPAEPGNNGLMNQMNGFKLFAMILHGFVFAKF
uniref:Uncharacterized protein n=1 Tax=Panagrolaimus sp. ES5 TaxID=591445 RepID=A0AC34FVK0_9BILA